jgi:inorganic triphosphatase YgiF
MCLPREVELKLAVPDGSVDLLGDHTALLPARQAEQQRHEVTTYFDTPDRALERHGLSLRVRCTNSQRVQTLKADSRAGIAAYRAEWEWPVQQDKPDLSTTLAEYG